MTAAGCEPDGIAEILRDAIETADWTRLRARLTHDAVLDTSSEAGRRQIVGADAIAAHLARPGPGEIYDWDAQEWPTGVALSFEWNGAGGTDRRRWYVRTDTAGMVRELWSTAARPTVVVADVVAPPPALLKRLGIAQVEPLSHGGNSGAALLRARGAHGTQFVLKRVGTGGADWLARATRDRGRTAQLYAAGAFERMPPSVAHGMVAVERSEDGAWIAMRDVHDLLLPTTARLSRGESRRILDAAAQLHRAFRGRVPDGAASLSDRIAMSSPAVAEAERGNPDLLPKQFEQGWDAFEELVDADVADAVLELTRSPSALADGLLRAHRASTLIHGDLRGDNLGLDGDRLVLIDWDLATAGTPTVEFAWYLAHSARRIDATHEQVEADYRAARADDVAEEEVELGMLSGLVQYGWRIAHSARVHPDPAETAWGRMELAWWVPRVRAALARLGGPPR
ncbi:MAG TPA: aminoglycoside phosphotransferase family protein [Gaiellaceae bacterium]|nr:aminoglycoside phosphotransferase family protein [Gaiellaceae bacterium]